MVNDLCGLFHHVFTPNTPPSPLSLPLTNAFNRLLFPGMLDKCCKYAKINPSPPCPPPPTPPPQQAPRICMAD